MQDLEVDDYSVAKVLILVTDENDNAPVFQANHYFAGQPFIGMKYLYYLKHSYLKLCVDLVCILDQLNSFSMIVFIEQI